MRSKRLFQAVGCLHSKRADRGGGFAPGDGVGENYTLLYKLSKLYSRVSEDHQRSHAFSMLISNISLDRG
jgi:hypothetical protein